MKNCNDCPYVSITEEMQNIRKTKEPHFCTKYKKQVFHLTKQRSHASFIYPCKECAEQHEAEDN